MEGKETEMPDLSYYNIPNILNEFSYHSKDFNMLFDMLFVVDSQFNREGKSFSEIFENFRWHPLDSFRLQCLDIAHDVVCHHERLEKYVRFFVEMYLCILKAEKGENVPSSDEITKFYKEFVEAFFRGMGCYESTMSLESHNIYCFGYLLLHLVENVFTSRRSLKGFDLISETEMVTKEALDMMLNSKATIYYSRWLVASPWNLENLRYWQKYESWQKRGFLIT